MVTFKKLGLKMIRDKKGGWHVLGNGVTFETTGDKGKVMHECLTKSGLFQFIKGEGWKRI